MKQSCSNCRHILVPVSELPCRNCKCLGLGDKSKWKPEGKTKGLTDRTDAVYPVEK